MNNLTPAQVKVIQTWTEERDSLLREIGVYSTQLGDLKKATKEEGLALADLHKSISEARGRIAELTALEDRHKNSLNSEIVELQIRKSKLEEECVLKEVEIKNASEKYNGVSSATAVLLNAHNAIADQIKMIEVITGNIIQTSKNLIFESTTAVSGIADVTTRVIEKGNANVAQTNIILEKLPKYIFELEKPIPVRRMYKAPAGTVIAPEGDKP